MPSDAAHQLRERICEAETNCFSNMHVQDFCTILLNHSRDKGFMTLLSEPVFPISAKKCEKCEIFSSISH